MKNFVQELFKKGRRREKNIFLFSNVVILVLVMAVVWSAYDAENKTITFPPSVQANASRTENDVNIDGTDTTDPTQENTYETTEPTIYEEEWPKYHIVEDGDTWYNLSIKYFGNDNYSDAIACINNRSISDYVFIGEELIIECEETLAEIAQSIEENKSNEDVYIFNKGTFGYKYGKRSNPAIDITVNKDCTGKNYTEEVDTSTFEYVGKHAITGYDPYCSHCCSGTGLMASGNYAINGYSVAAGYPLGTTLYIEGYGFYVVEDRGVNGKHIDIAAPGHQSCYDLTNTSVAVYIVPNNN